MMRRTSFVCALALAAGAGAVLAAADAAPAAGAARTIEVTAGEYKFEPAVINVTEGEHIVLKARVTDGKKHGLSIKELGVKEALPRTGEPVSIELTAGAPGTYTIACSVYCGNGHSRMKGQLVVAAR
jgi:cytochrome c oxidase subunit 2